MRELLGHSGPDGRWRLTKTGTDAEVCVSIRRGHGAAGAVFFENPCAAEGGPSRQWFVPMDAPKWLARLRQQVELLLSARSSAPPTSKRAARRGGKPTRPRPLDRPG